MLEGLVHTALAFFLGTAVATAALRPLRPRGGNEIAVTVLGERGRVFCEFFTLCVLF